MQNLLIDHLNDSSTSKNDRTIALFGYIVAMKDMNVSTTKQLQVVNYIASKVNTADVLNSLNDYKKQLQTNLTHSA